jgi:hypothetical protein
MCLFQSKNALAPARAAAGGLLAKAKIDGRLSGRYARPACRSSIPGAAGDDAWRFIQGEVASRAGSIQASSAFRALPRDAAAYIILEPLFPAPAAFRAKWPGARRAAFVHSGLFHSR